MVNQLAIIIAYIACNTQITIIENKTYVYQQWKLMNMENKASQPRPKACKDPHLKYSTTNNNNKKEQNRNNTADRYKQFQT